jgi:hypothetical protein
MIVLWNQPPVKVLQNTIFEGNALKNGGPIGKREDEQRREERGAPSAK